MKKVILLLLVSNAAFSSARFFRPRFAWNLGAYFGTSVSVEAHNFSQKLDHFDVSNNEKWNQRYWALKNYFKVGGPAFLRINGEWTATGDEEFKLPWVSYAKVVNAYCFSLEHRFYGRSWPRKKSLNLLSTSQALSDIANFIKGATEIFELPKNTKWIVFGCSYAGMLAAWARLKYPHMIHGAVASSAPISTKVNNVDYLQIVEKSLKSYNPECVESITKATEEMAGLINNTKLTKDISKKFQLCDDRPENAVELAKNFFDDMVTILCEAVQHDNFWTEFNIAKVCNIMINHSGTKLEAFVGLRRMYKERRQVDPDEKSIQELWAYQVCSELGGFISYDKTRSFSALSHLFPIDETIKKTCEPFFGPNFGAKEMNEKITQMNLLYGGSDFNIGNTLFVQGSNDPWYPAGLYDTKNDSLYETIFINGASHCCDIYEASSTDSAELKEARQKILKTLKKWLNIESCATQHGSNSISLFQYFSSQIQKMISNDD